jgi:hypothetical protein
MITVRDGLWKLIGCQFLPPAVLGQLSTHSPTFASRMSGR